MIPEPGAAEITSQSGKKSQKLRPRDSECAEKKKKPMDKHPNNYEIMLTRIQQELSRLHRGGQGWNNTVSALGGVFLPSQVWLTIKNIQSRAIKTGTLQF